MAVAVGGGITVEEEDFRSGYFFDVCLLGFCDTVTGTLAKVMDDIEERGREEGKGGRCGSSDGTTNASLQMALDEGAVLGDIAHTHNCRAVSNGATDRAVKRTLLFPGAIIEDQNIATNDRSDVSYAEVAHCDGCQNIIRGAIMKCVDCFDFDLCDECYCPAVREKHYRGTHTFVKEQ